MTFCMTREDIDPDLKFMKVVQNICFQKTEGLNHAHCLALSLNYASNVVLGQPLSIRLGLADASVASSARIQLKSSFVQLRETTVVE